MPMRYHVGEGLALAKELLFGRYIPLFPRAEVATRVLQANPGPALAPPEIRGDVAIPYDKPGREPRGMQRCKNLVIRRADRIVRRFSTRESLEGKADRGQFAAVHR